MSLYIGNEVFNITAKPKFAIIEDFLYEQDFLCIVGEPKVGKSIIAQQLAMCIAGGQSFLGEHEVKTQGDIVYFQAEGSLSEMRQRFVDMEKALPTERSHIAHFYKPGVMLNTPEGYAEFVTTIDQNHIDPVAIIIDPLYMAFKGDLCSQTTLSEICTVIAKLKASYNCAIILTHHSSKQTYSIKGDKINKGDNAAFGSAFLKANVDSMLMFRLEMEKRVLTCDTQRSGKIRQRTELDLITPIQAQGAPLILKQSSSKLVTTNEKVRRILVSNKKPLSTLDIGEQIGVHRNAVNREIKKFMADHKVKRVQKGKCMTYYWTESKQVGIDEF